MQDRTVVVINAGDDRICLINAGNDCSCWHCMLNLVTVTCLQRSALLCFPFVRIYPPVMFATDDSKALCIHPRSPLSRIMSDV